MAMKSTGKVCMKSAESRFCRSFTGDIKTPVKYASRELKKLFSQVEEEMVDTFIKEEIPEQYQNVYRERLQEGKDDSLEGQILSVEDKIDLLYETFGEIQNVIRSLYFSKFMK